MNTAPKIGEVFGRLRRRLVGVVIVALLGFALLVAVLAWRDSVQTDRWLDTLLRGEASRSAALIYVGVDGKVTTEALVDDHVSTQAEGLLIVERRGADLVVLHQGGREIRGDWRPLARQCVQDAPEDGTFAQIGDLRVAGMPWWRDTGDPQPSGCSLAIAATPRLIDSAVVWPSALGSLALLLVLSAMVWWAAGRSLEVAESALADRERFLATAAHEMRSPLARMRVAAEAALAEVHGRRSGAEPHLRTLVATADSAGRVVSNLLLASRIDHAEIPVDTAPVHLERIAAEVETIIDGLVVDVSEPVVVTGDGVLLRQAMTNLVDNALRHGHEGDEVSEVILTVERREGRAVIRVADDGPGIPAGVDVTAPYVSGVAGGNGLGLPLVRWIAARHGAELWVGSADGRDGLSGAAVELRFPA